MRLSDCGLVGEGAGVDQSAFVDVQNCLKIVVAAVPVANFQDKFDPLVRHVLETIWCDLLKHLFALVVGLPPANFSVGPFHLVQQEFAGSADLSHSHYVLLAVLELDEVVRGGFQGGLHVSFLHCLECL